MTIRIRLAIGQLFTDDGVWAILRSFGSGFIGARLPVGGDLQTSIFPSPEIVKPEGDYGVVFLAQFQPIKILAPTV